MTIAQFFVTYSVCWWLVLFMLLPSGAEPVKDPETGHAPSAPANPRLRQKFLKATLWAFLPAVLIGIIASQARAEDDIMHAGRGTSGQVAQVKQEKTGDTTYHVGGGGCNHTAYTMAEDVAVKDGHGHGDTHVAPANLGGGQDYVNTDSMEIPLNVPLRNYTKGHKNIDLDQTYVSPGKLTVKKDGETLLNGKPISNNQTDSGNCNE